MMLIHKQLHKLIRYVISRVFFGSVVQKNVFSGKGYNSEDIHFRIIKNVCN